MRGAAGDVSPAVGREHGRVPSEPGKAPCLQSPVQVHRRQGWSTASSSAKPFTSPRTTIGEGQTWLQPSPGQIGLTKVSREGDRSCILFSSTESSPFSYLSCTAPHKATAKQEASSSALSLSWHSLPYPLIPQHQSEGT